MADPKRHSTGAKLPTRTGPPSSSELDGTIQKATNSKSEGPQHCESNMAANAIMSRVRVHTVNAGHSIEGVLLVADQSSNTVVVDSTPTAPTRTLHVITVSNISDFQILGLADKKDKENEEPSTNGPVDNAIPSPLPKIDFAAVKAREEAAIRKMKERDAQRGKGVTKEGQEIFDWFHRTYGHLSPSLCPFSAPVFFKSDVLTGCRLPTRWADQTIVVSDAVLIEPPYKQENVKGPKDKQPAVVHTKKVLEGYYSKKKGGGGATQQGGQQKPAPAVPVPHRKGG